MTISSRRRAGQLCVYETLVIPAHRVTFNYLSSLECLKGKDTTTIPHRAKIKCPPAGDTPSLLQRQPTTSQVPFQATSSAILGATSALPAGAVLSAVSA